jgi:hypothetical protein
MRIASLVGIVGAVLCSACIGPRVLVLPSGSGVVAEPRSSDCKVEFFRGQPPTPYEEIAALHAEGGDTFRNGPKDFQEALREKACQLGADALLVTHEYSGPGGTMSAAAVRYRSAVLGR